MQVDQRHTEAPLVIKEKSSKQMTADVCKNALGDFGPWQLRSVLLISLVKIPSAWQMASILFTSPVPGPGNFWCARPSEYQHWDAQRWINLSHPTQPGDTNLRDPCNLYDLAYEILIQGEDSDAFGDRNATNIYPCEDFEFSTPHTVVKQWNLVCGREALIGISQAFYLLGISVGGVLCWKLLFRFSPRQIMLTSTAIKIIAATSISFTPYYELHMFLRLVTAIACTCMFTCGYIICTDITNGKWRTIIGACYEHMWSVGVITLACLAFAFNNWPDLQLAISIPTVLILLFSRWIPDSPIWLINNGYYDKARDILEEAAEFNKTKTIVNLPAQDMKRKHTDVQWKDIFKSSKNMAVILSLHILWAATVVNYYAALLNVKNLGENVILNTGIAGFAEIIGCFLGLVLLLRCKRKWLVIGILLIIGGCTCTLCWCVPPNAVEHKDALFMAIAMTGRVAIACSLAVLQVSSSEMLPEAHRSIGIVSSVTFARVCLLTTILIVSLVMYGVYISLTVFGVTTMVGGVASLVLYFTDKEKDKVSIHL